MACRTARKDSICSSEMPRRAFLAITAGGLLAEPSAAEAEKRLDRRRSFRQCALTVAVPLLVFALHVTLFGTWIDDDAGISFAYARNLATGHGLVSQPGAARVEGYSNPLWVLLISALLRLGVFHVVWTPRLVAFVLTAGSFAIVTTALARAGFSSGVATAALTLVALQPSFVIWSASGLENPLYVFLQCLLMLGVAKLLTDPRSSWRAAFFTGLVVAGLAATRPDGAIFLALVPLILLLRAWTSRELRPWLAPFIAYSTVALTLVGALVGFRWFYFNDVFPNTYYMKGGPTVESIGSIVWLLPDTLLKIWDLAQAIVGAKGATWFLVLVFASTIFLITVRHFHRILAVLALFSACSSVVYLLLPGDWMAEYRFASPFFLFFNTYIVTMAWALCESTMRTPVARRTFTIVLALLLASSLTHVARRSVAFANKPTVPLAVVADFYGYRYNRVAAALGLEGASLLAPDMGGTLLYSKLTVFDLGGLCDRTIARTIGKDQRAFYDYVFVGIRPTFIHVHSAWTKLANLDGDERFRRDYVPIWESTTREGSTSRLEGGALLGEMCCAVQ